VHGDGHLGCPPARLSACLGMFPSHLHLPMSACAVPCRAVLCRAVLCCAVQATGTVTWGGLPWTRCLPRLWVLRRRRYASSTSAVHTPSAAHSSAAAGACYAAAGMFVCASGTAAGCKLRLFGAMGALVLLLLVLLCEATSWQHRQATHHLPNHLPTFLPPPRGRAAGCGRQLCGSLILVSCS
jgi:hypothetical protein